MARLNALEDGKVNNEELKKIAADITDVILRLEQTETDIRMNRLRADDMEYMRDGDREDIERIMRLLENRVRDEGTIAKFEELFAEIDAESQNGSQGGTDSASRGETASEPVSEDEATANDSKAEGNPLLQTLDQLPRSPGPSRMPSETSSDSEAAVEEELYNINRLSAKRYSALSKTP